jgi:Carboxypeptidase regulatory-like domain
MKQLACRFVVLLTLVGIAGWWTPARTQEVTASVVGTVVDSSGAPIKGASVKATDTERGTVWTAETNESGAYSLLRLPIGSYGVKITAPGFQTTEFPPFTLALNQNARLDANLKVGKVSETVEVTGAAPVLQAEDAQVGTVIDSNTVTNLALTTRNYVQLTLLSPGAVSTDPTSFNTGSNTAEEGGRPYINGNREQDNNFLLDGVDNNQASDNDIGYTPSPDAIGEFNLITQNASAEFGNFNGGIVNVTIKSGTNQIHGDVFEFFRNNIFNANKWESGLTTPVSPTPTVRWNMFGGTVGGPIIKNKLFFFADYQGGRLDHPAASSAITVLTPAEIAGNFSALCQKGFTGGVCNDRTATGLVTDQLYNPCQPGKTPCSIVPNTQRVPFSNNVIPTQMLDPVFTALTTNALYPVSTHSLPSGFGQAVNTKTQQFNSDQGDFKLDFSLSDRDHLNARFSKGNQYDPTINSQPLLGNTLNEAYLLNGTINWTHSFSSNLLNEVRYGKNYVKLPHGLTTFAPSVGALATSLGIVDGNPTGVDGLPEFGYAGGDVTNINQGGGLLNIGAADVVEKFSTTTTSFNDVLVYTHGRHVIKSGFQLERYNLNVFYSGNGGELGAEIFGNGPGGNYTGTATSVAGVITPSAGDGSADWALGLPEDIGRGASGAPSWHQRDWLFAGFAQDDWRITDNLTLNIGLRYEARTPWIETNNRQTSVNIFTGALELPGKDPVPNGLVGSNGFSAGLYNSVYGLHDFQPRLGFAWSPKVWDGKTVIRGAFTISSYLEGTGVNLRDPQNPPYAAPKVETGNVTTGVPTFSTATAFAAAAAAGAGNPFVGATMNAWSGTIQPAIADQYNLTVQREIAHGTTFQMGYVGQRTVHLMVPEWLAQGDLQPNGAITYPFIGGQNPTGTVIDGVTTTSPTFGPNGFGNVKLTASDGNMNYNSLQSVLQKRYSNGLEAQVSYTWEKCMTNDDGYYGSWGTYTQTAASGNYWQNLYNPNGDYAQCYWDAKHVVSSYAVYELPFGRGKQFGHDMAGALNAAVGNWSINPIVSWHSGFPLSLRASDESGTGTPESRPDCNGPVSYPKTIVPGQGLQWFSPSAFSAAASGTFGNCPAQGPVIGPGYFDTDISLQKNFLITESKKLQFRADFLNATNHPSFAAPSTTIGTGMGITSATQDAREMQFALKFYF